MDQIVIQGGRALKGQVPISGAKNAALKLMCASLLTDQPLQLNNVPQLADIKGMIELLAQHGVQITQTASHSYKLQAVEITSTTAPYDIVRKMRASILVLGPLLTRMGEAKVSLPGGCAIGARPVDLHIAGLEALGAEIELADGYIHAKAPHGLRGAAFTFAKVSMGATENMLMAATLAKGTTILNNAAREPEIVDLGQCLQAMGAQIEGLGTDTIIIHGVDALHGAEHRVVADRIEIGTYIAAAAMTGGELELLGADPALMQVALANFEKAGVGYEVTERGLRVWRAGDCLHGVDVMTEPHPGFPTDLQAQFMAMMCIADGAALMTETIFENRFMHAPELMRMGANITIHHASALVRGVPRLKGAPVMATDLRASVALILAGLAAEGETRVQRIYHLDRGYEAFDQKLAACGADIQRVAG